MAYITKVDGVYFSEGTLEGQVIGPIVVKAPTQNTNLAETKKLMAAEAKRLGGNGVMDFRYSQKADKGANLFKWDTERLNLTGTVVVLGVEPEVS
ncbi:MAG: hypothetical protein WCK24_05020 [Actinomycetes bacterium]